MKLIFGMEQGLRLLSTPNFFRGRGGTLKDDPHLLDGGGKTFFLYFEIGFSRVSLGFSG